MARDPKPQLRKLRELGERLRKLRTRAGISQMELAEAMGFNPTHGYKYVLRLEKGLVPNPTLRTLAGFLRACGAGWNSIVDVLPTLQSDEAAAPSVAAGSEPLSPEPVETPAQVRRPTADSRPMREVLRQQRQEERVARTRDFWNRVGQAEEQAMPLLHGSRLTSATRRALTAFLRALCAVINSASERKVDPSAELEKLMQSAQASGLDHRLLIQVRDICISVFGRVGSA
ncbi:MAG: helix-turn-helix transcriptional regulator [candidate division WOR-3 bacterium]